MGFFRKDPPPPKRTVPGWVQLATPIIFMIVMGLLGLVYNGLANDVEKIENKMEQKVDNKTLQMQIEVLKEKDDASEEYRKKTDTRLEKLIIEMQQMKYQQNPSTIPAATPPPVPTEPQITPEQLKFYMSLKPEQKEAFRKAHPAFEGMP